ncbi:HlyD family secretion protein [Cytobacillus firmus]|uniref:HlyD family secretion protein n=2 Tax=Cytobacillus TaxID=2675230 RepID=A0A366JY70_CYTFI|nr:MULTISPECIES: efflux RND transporter periplasmic adaptor subunit [Cytobacillus]RBP94384.1 HlyD family secretion protein [Cytobacillus firmus]TDX43131.1 HlyD family secretion protein [Cytobacillus oceanisediminis]
MKRKLILSAIGLLLLAAGILFLVNKMKNSHEAASAEEIAYYKVSKHKVSNNLLIPGLVNENDKSQYYYDPSLGKEYQIHVNEGDTVKKGDLLYSYVNEELGFQMKKTNLQLRAANIDYSNILNKKIDLDKKIKEAQEEEKEVLEKEYSEIKYQFDLKLIELESLQLTKKEIEDKLANLKIYSRSAGKVQKIVQDHEVQSTDQTMEGAPSIISLLENDRYSVTGKVSELQRLSIEKGMKYTVKTKAIPDAAWKGEITDISSSPINQLENGEENSLSSYTFSGDLKSQDKLLPGFHISIELELAPIDALLIPKKSIFRTIDDKEFVLVARNGELVKEDILTGLEKGDLIEAIGNIEEGEQVVKDAKSNAAVGMKVN